MAILIILIILTLSVFLSIAACKLRRDDEALEKYSNQIPEITKQKYIETLEGLFTTLNVINVVLILMLYYLIS